MSEYSAWIGRSKSAVDTISFPQARLMAKAMEIDPDTTQPTLESGSILPHGWHWIYFLEADPTYLLGHDGHAKRGGFLPPVSLPRRMWAGSRLSFHAPIVIGETLKKQSTIKNIAEKSGRSGALCFVTVLHEYFKDDVLLLSEEQDLVYREEPDLKAPPPRETAPPQTSQVSKSVHPNPVWLFRYSALTFNGHRIHYDVDYARDQEGYPGLIFHGPLTATLLLELASDLAGQKPLTQFSFKGVSPIFDTGPFTIHGSIEDHGIDLWATTQSGALAVNAQAEILN